MSWVNFVAKPILNKLFKEYGEMINLKIDSKTKNIELDMLLNGEKESITIKIENYEIIKDGEKHFITCNNVKASREWLKAIIDNIIFTNVFPEKRIEIDSKYANLLKILI